MHLNQSPLCATKAHFVQIMVSHSGVGVEAEYWMLLVYMKSGSYSWIETKEHSDSK